MVRGWATREYTEIPWKTLLYAVAALAYFVNPLDAVPDALFMLGLVDDVAVVTAVVSALHDDLQAFSLWEAQRSVEATPAAQERSTSETQDPSRLPWAA